MAFKNNSSLSISIVKYSYFCKVLFIINWHLLNPWLIIIKPMDDVPILKSRKNVTLRKSS